MKLTLRGEPLNLTRPQPSLVRVLEYLDGLKDGILVEKDDLYESCHVAQGTLSNLVTMKSLDEHTFKPHGRHVYYGNKRTAKAARKQYGLEK